jgi:hypothetical protein
MVRQAKQHCAPCSLGCCMLRWTTVAGVVPEFAFSGAFPDGVIITATRSSQGVGSTGTAPKEI